MYFDTHLHLDAAEFDADRAEVVARMRQAGVEQCLLPSVAVGNFGAVRALAGQLPGAVYAYGIHPLYVTQANTADLDTLHHALASDSPVAVGEIGLDGYVADANPVVQEQYFCAQLKLAREFDLPVVLHVRRAQDRVLKWLRHYGVRRGIAHAFNGSAQQAEAFIAQGFALGFGGAMTFTGSTRIRALAANLPLQSLVLESDAPDIPPAWQAGGRNEPAFVARFGEILAQLRGMAPAELARVTTENARRALNIAA